MNRWILRLLPERATAQIAAIVFCGLFALHLLLTTVLFVALPRAEPRDGPYPPELGVIARQLRAAPDAASQRTIIATSLAAGGRLGPLTEGAPLRPEDMRGPERDLLMRLGESLRGVADVVAMRRPGRPGPPDIAIRLPDGTGLAVAPGQPGPPRRALGGPVFVMLSTLLVLIAALTLWATLAVVRPLTSLAKAAERFDPDQPGDIALAQGPLEIRRLVGALNRMAKRIRALVEQRTRMVAAVSHDLRTLITRLRLRAEEVDDEGRRTAMLGDLASMERMANGALAYLRDGRVVADRVAVDLPALLQSVCDDFADQGHDVAYRGPERAAATCDIDQITRAVTNLVDNALKFGATATVRLSLSDSEVVVGVEDDGPGIPASEVGKVTEPFYRSDAARTLGPGSGFGLGLAIANAVAQAHGGRLSLSGRPEGGLEACIIWPRGPAATPSPRP